MLQLEALDLAGAISLVGATLKTLNDYQKEEKYMKMMMLRNLQIACIC